MSAAKGKARIATGVLLVTLVTGTMGYTIASAVLTYQDLGFGAEISFAAVGMMLSLALSGLALTRFGQPHCLTACDMKANGFFEPLQHHGLRHSALADLARLRRDGRCERVCFEATARYCAQQGDKIYRFAPTDWEEHLKNC